MNQRASNNRDLVISYLALRKALGFLGLFLPAVLALGAAIIFRTDVQTSVSSYYYTGMGDVFVGTMFAIGLFLFSYRGHDRLDDIAGDLGCIFAIGVALFPTAPNNPGPDYNSFIGNLHLFFASLMFLTLIYFSLFLFTKTDPTRPPTRKKLQRNMVYRACGIIMALCIVLIVVLIVLPGEVATPIEAYNPIFWLESVMIVAFGISWLTKGEALLGD